jgi:hypothetical protein
MRPLFALAGVLIAAAPAAALPSVEEVKANVRKAVGFDAFRKMENGLALEGQGAFFGLPGPFRMVLHPDGRYVRVLEASGTHAVGFDGTTRWGRNFAEPVVELHFDEADRDRFLFGVLCHRWLAADGGFTAVVDEGASRAYRLELVLTHPDAGVAARLTIDPATWRPEALQIPGTSGSRVFDFADYRTIAGVAVPVRIGQDRHEGGQSWAAERAGPAPAGNPFARPAYRPPVAFDPAVPANLEARKGPGGIVLVRGAVDGKPVPWLMIDTGNSGPTVLSVRAAEQLGLPAAGGVTVYGVGGSTRSRFRAADRLTVGPVTVPRPVLAELPDAVGAPFAAKIGAELGGFLGQDFLSRVVLELDPTAGTAAVYDPAAYKLPAGGAWEPVRFNGRSPCVRAAFAGGPEGWFLFDTGSEPAVVFNIPAVLRLKLLDGVRTTPHVMYGAGGEEFVRKGPGGEFQAFGRTARTATALYATDPRGGHTDPYCLGTFGPSALGPGTIVFDYPNRRIGFVPRG